MVWPHCFLYCPADGAGVFPDVGILSRSLPWASRTSKIQKRVPGKDVQSSGSHSFDHCHGKSVTFITLLMFLPSTNSNWTLQYAVSSVVRELGRLWIWFMQRHERFVFWERMQPTLTFTASALFYDMTFMIVLLDFRTSAVRNTESCLRLWSMKSI